MLLGCGVYRDAIGGFLPVDRTHGILRQVRRMRNNRFTDDVNCVVPWIIGANNPLHYTVTSDRSLSPCPCPSQSLTETFTLRRICFYQVVLNDFPSLQSNNYNKNFLSLLLEATEMGFFFSFFQKTGSAPVQISYHSHMTAERRCTKGAFIDVYTRIETDINSTCYFSTTLMN